MAKLERVYRRTGSGQKAWQDQDPAPSAEHRRILARSRPRLHRQLLFHFLLVGALSRLI